MKKSLILPLVFGAMLSCGEHTAADTLTDLQNEGESLSDSYMTDVKFNDALVSEATLIDVELYKIMDLDDKNVPEEELRAELAASIAVLDKIDENLSTVDPSWN